MCCEADVLRDEGEAYAAGLRAAGVPVTTVRYNGITHDFMMLNPLSGTTATRAAVAQAAATLRAALGTDEERDAPWEARSGVRSRTRAQSVHMPVASRESIAAA